MDAISNMAVFVKVVEKESFSAAASILNCSPSSISKRINQLEYEVGAKLLNRSTHGFLNLTEAGQVYLERARKIIYEIENARDSVREVTEALRGTLKIHLTPGTGLKIALPVVLEFMKEYPSLSVEISIRPESVDILRFGFDVSIRSGSVEISEVSFAGVETRQLAGAQYTICAAKSYFERYGKPSHPHDLASHNCLISSRQRSPDRWWFRSGQKKFAVKVQGTLVADHWTVIYEAAQAGLGIARVLQVSPTSGAIGKLETIFEDMMVPDRALWALVPCMQPMPKKIDLFVSFVSEALRRQRDAIAQSSTSNKTRSGSHRRVDA